MAGLNKKAQILDAIQNNPGIHIRGLIRETGFENGVITHHLNKLEKQGIIKSQKLSRHRRYYSTDVPEEEFCIIRNMRKPTKKEAIFSIIVQGSPTFGDLVEKLNKSPSTVSWNVSELVKEGIVEKCKKDGRQCYRIINRKRFSETFHKQFKKLFDEKLEHAEDIYLAL
jgi:predicted transcriptional regulator